MTGCCKLLLYISCTLWEWREVLLIMPGQYCKVRLQDKQGYLVTLYTALIVCDWVSAVSSPSYNVVHFQGWLCVLCFCDNEKCHSKGYALCKRNPFLSLGWWLSAQGLSWGAIALNICFSKHMPWMLLSPWLTVLQYFQFLFSSLGASWRTLVY